ncbi:MAG: XVIPCD domain-containing protein [Rhodanobacter sp.]
MAQLEWDLGQTSAHYEGHGPGTISSGKGDHGDISYGTYQFSTSPNGGSLKEYLHNSAYKEQFKGLEPKTPAFDAKWKELAKNDPGFAQNQHNMMKTTHYDPAAAGLKAHGIDLSSRGAAVQDALWSTSVQFGPGNFKKGTGAQGIFEKGLEEKFGNGYELSKLSDKDIVGAVQDYKIKHNEQLFHSSPKLWHSLEDRANHEKADLLKLADHGSTLDKDGVADARALESAHSDTTHPHHATVPRLDHAANPDNPLYKEALAGVHKAEAERHIAPGLHSERLAAALVVAAKSEGITRIDSVLLSDRGHRAFAVEKGTLPGINDKLAFVETKDAIHTTLAHSSAALAQVNQQHDLALAKVPAPPLFTPEPAASVYTR